VFPSRSPLEQRLRDLRAPGILDADEEDVHFGWASSL
jgi:hypothetical protein